MPLFSKIALSLAAVIAFAVPAAAHPKLLSAAPAANASAKAVSRIVLKFSERLTPRLSGATLIMTGMPGMASHPDMKMTGVNAAIGSDGTSIILTSARPLPAGTYRVDWHVVGADTHRITGTHSFTVN
ncbi:copper homeostasis periplasmic binding protein CopC [Sphingomonas koreensis]